MLAAASCKPAVAIVRRRNDATGCRSRSRTEKEGDSPASNAKYSQIDL